MSKLQWARPVFIVFGFNNMQLPFKQIHFQSPSNITNIASMAAVRMAQVASIICLCSNLVILPNASRALMNRNFLIIILKLVAGAALLWLEANLPNHSVG